MEWVTQAWEFVRELDVHLESIMREYRLATYLILAAIVFCETGLVVTPFLPGDSLLFAAGAITAKTKILNVWLLMAILMAASWLGDNVNYFMGRRFGSWIKRRDVWFIRKKYLRRTERFYQRHGGKTVVLARFIPIIRTFAPFVAGAGAMKYSRFIGFSILASLLWVPIFTLAGFYFGSLPWIKDNFELIVVAIIAVSLAPIAFEMTRNWLRRRKWRPSSEPFEP